jgi:hypothetical protein
MADYSLLTVVNLLLDPHSPALICKTCQYALAVSKSQVTSHLSEKHRISLDSRRHITPLIRSLNILNPTDLPPRHDHSLVHPHLKVYGGYACVSCIYRTINLDKMTRHVSSCCPPPRVPSRRRQDPDAPIRRFFFRPGYAEPATAVPSVWSFTLNFPFHIFLPDLPLLEPCLAAPLALASSLRPPPPFHTSF